MGEHKFWHAFYQPDSSRNHFRRPLSVSPSPRIRITDDRAIRHYNAILEGQPVSVIAGLGDVCGDVCDLLCASQDRGEKPSLPGVGICTLQETCSPQSASNQVEAQRFFEKTRSSGTCSVTKLIVICRPCKKMIRKCRRDGGQTLELGCCPSG